MNLSKLAVVYYPTNKIKKDPSNTKMHPPSQVAQIIRSIQRFGFNDPIGIDEHDVIVEGEGRWLAAQKMGTAKVPIIRLRGLTPEEKRAYSIAHNKINMNSDFDMAKMKLELARITTQDIRDATGFTSREVGRILDLPKDVLGEADDELPGISVLAPVITGVPFVGKYQFFPMKEKQIPTLKGTYEAWIGKTYEDKIEKAWAGNYLFLFGAYSSVGLPVDRSLLGFYMPDDKFEVVWKKLEQVTSRFINAGVKNLIMPNYSLWTTDSLSVHIYNTYRCKYVARYWQEAGLNVVPDLNWASMESLEMSLEGIPRKCNSAAVQLQTLDGGLDGDQAVVVTDCLSAALDEIKPKVLLAYGGKPGLELATKICKAVKVPLIPVLSRKEKIGKVVRTELRKKPF